jgi:hypothetical protein
MGSHTSVAPFASLFEPLNSTRKRFVVMTLTSADPTSGELDSREKEAEAKLLWESKRPRAKVRLFISVVSVALKSR